MTDPVNMGTYNFFNPEKEKILHTVFDVFPYMIYGNTPADMFLYAERIGATIEGIRLRRESSNAK